MNTTISRVLLVLGGVVVGFALGRSGPWFSDAGAANPTFGGSQPTTSEGRTPKSRVDAPTDAHGSRIRVEVPIPATPEAEAPATAPTVADAFKTLGEALTTPAGSTNQEDYLAKYAGASTDELRLAEFALNLRLSAETRGAWAELLAAGRYESQIVGQADASGLLASGNGKISSTGFDMQPLGDGRTEIRKSQIDPKEYPLIGQLQDESHWLGTYLRHDLGIR